MRSHLPCARHKVHVDLPIALGIQLATVLTVELRADLIVSVCRDVDLPGLTCAFHARSDVDGIAHTSNAHFHLPTTSVTTGPEWTGPEATT